MEFLSERKAYHSKTTIVDVGKGLLQIFGNVAEVFNK